MSFIQPIHRSILLLICLTVLGVYSAYACSCVPMTFEMKVVETDFIFVGKVVSVKEDTTIKRQPGEVRKYNVKLNVTKKFKGVKHNQINLVQYDITYVSSCPPGWNLKEGETYLIYASGNGKEITHLTACAPTQKFDPNSSDYKDLLKYKAKKTRKYNKRQL
jgi:hypothetical protein